MSPPNRTRCTVAPCPSPSTTAPGRNATAQAPSGPDGPCAVAFRPGAVTLGSGQPATIRHVAFAGDLVQVFLRSGPFEICAEARPGPELRPGAETRWHVPPESCLVLKE